MPNAASGSRIKRKRTSIRSARRIPRTLRASSHAIVPRTVSYDMSFTSDVALGFGFSPTTLWVNNASSTGIPGASDITALYDMCRIQKVEVTMLPGNNVADYALNSVTSGQRNIPYVYHAVDNNSGGNPTLNEIQQFGNCKVASFDKVIKRTIYPAPKFSAASTGTISLQGPALRNVWLATGSDEACFGFKVYMDLLAVNLTYDVARITFKIYYECKDCN